MINGQSILTNVLYVSNLGVNLLFEKKLCINNLKESFNKNKLYLHDKKRRQMLRTFDRRELYIVDNITSQLSEYVLTASVISKIIIMSTIIDLIDNKMITDLFKLKSFLFLHIDTSSQISKLETCRLWHKKFAYFESAKLRNLHKIITLKKIISTVED